MKENFDFDRIGKRLPYTAPDGFLDDVENSVMQRINQEVHPSKPKRNLHLWYSVTGGLAAASIALLIVFTPFHTQTKKSHRCMKTPPPLAVRHLQICRAAVRTNVINLKRLLNGKQNVWKYQNGEEKSDSDGREKDV